MLLLAPGRASGKFAFKEVSVGSGVKRKLLGQLLRLVAFGVYGILL